MIDPSESIYYLTYGLICLCLIVAYIKLRNDEGTIITTKDFSNFQFSFLTAYSATILFELIASASFFHTFLSLSLTLEQITKLYLATIISQTIGHIFLEIIEFTSRKEKCILSCLLYSISMFSIIFGSSQHYEMLLIGRLLYGFASSLKETNYESYAVHQHSSHGFPEDWLHHMFTLLTHLMSLMSILTGILGQFAAGMGSSSSSSSNLEAPASLEGTESIVVLSCIGFVFISIYILVSWEKDINISRYMMSGFLFNMNSAISSLRSHRSTFILLLISSLCESSILIFTFYWAPWLTDLFREEDHHLSYEMIFSCFVATSMLGNYCFQIFFNNKTSGTGVTGGGIDNVFQGVLIASSACYFLGAIVSSAVIAFFIALLIQCCVGIYWPCIGYYRGRIIAPELRNSFLTIPRSVNMLVSYLFLCCFSSVFLEF
jgi:hypothetical protein